MAALMTAVPPVRHPPPDCRTCRSRREAIPRAPRRRANRQRAPTCSP